MTDEIEIKDLGTLSVEEVSDFVASIFHNSVAEHYEDDGVKTFLDYIKPEKFQKRLNENHFILTAYSSDDILVGLIEMKDHKHLSNLFVKSDQQRKGIGKKLLAAAIDKCKQFDLSISKISVNSAPNSLEAYKRMGFKETDTEKAMNGIRFIPMSLDI